MGSSKKQTTGYRYSMGLHFGLCHGPVDKVLQVKAGDRRAWAGDVTANTVVAIDAPELFGGDKKEGGLRGDLSFLMGGPAQAVESYLASKLGAAIPAFRGILSAVWRGGQISSNNPYIKPWSFQVQRILQGWNGGAGTAWYASKALVRVGSITYTTASFQEPFVDGLAPYAVQTGSAASFSIVSDDYGDALLAAKGANNIDAIFRNFPAAGTFTACSFKFKTTARRQDDDGVIEFRNSVGGIVFGFVPGLQGDALYRPTFTFSDDPFGTQYKVGTTATDVGVWYEFKAEYNPVVGQFVVTIKNLATGSIHGTATVPVSFTSAISRLVIRTDSYIGTGSGDVVWDDIAITFGGITFVEGMNPAHIIYQCLTDTEWGMGYPAAAVDADSFTAAADVLHSEGFGLCMLWNKQEIIQNFIKVVADHAGATLSVNPRTGKFVLKLIRDDYDPGTLDVFDPSNIITLDDYQRQAWGETTNEVTVVFREWETNKDSAVTIQDMANIQTQGAVVPASRQYPGVPNAALAQRLAMRDLNTVSTPLAKVRFTTNRAAWDKIPGEVFRLTWPKLGVADVVFRVLEVSYGTLQNGTIVIDAAEDVFGLPTNTYVGEQPSEWVDPSSEPLATPARKLIEAPYWDLARGLTPADLDYLDDLSGFLETVASRPSGDALNYEINARTGSADYEERAIGEFAPTATLVATLPIGEGPDAITFDNASDVEIFEVGGYAMIDDEVVGITALDATLGTATITRGLLDTVPAEHLAGARIWFVDGFQGADQTEYATGETVDVKLLPRTGLGELALDLAPTNSITMATRHNRPYPPGRFRIGGLLYPAELVEVPLAATWTHRDRLSQTAYLVEQDEASIGPEAGTTYTARLYDDHDGTLVDLQTGIAGTSWAGPTLNGVYRLRLEVEAVRAGLASWQAQTHVFDYFNGARLLEDGDNRETEGGEFRSLE